MAFTNRKLNLGLLCIGCLIFVLTASNAFSNIRTIKCKAPNDGDHRVWKYSREPGFYEFWTLHSDKFYPFCTVGYPIQFPNGFLCAYDADRNIGTIATFIDLQEKRVIDVLILEDTVLNDPATWRQKTEAPCDMIRN